MKAVFLDVDDTLIDYQRAARIAYVNALGSDQHYDRWLKLDYHERYLAGEFDFRTMRMTRMAEFLALVGRDDDAPRAEEIEQRRYDGMSSHYFLFDDVRPCLDMLRERGLRIGLITNNESAHQRTKLAIVGLDRLVDAIAISEEVGAAKPDGRIFAHACGQLGVAPSEAMHIGDNVVADVQGAAAAGLQAVWLDRHRQHDGRPTDYPVISGLSEVAALLG